MGIRTGNDHDWIARPLPDFFYQGTDGIAFLVPFFVDLLASREDQFVLAVKDENFSFSFSNLINLSHQNLSNGGAVFVINRLTLDFLDPLIEVLFGADHKTPAEGL